MAGRYTTIKPLQTCLSPVTIYHDGVKYVVPCGKCSACILNKANQWSMRVGAEIESNPFSIFFTLTYSNKYVPKLHKTHFKQGFYTYDSDNEYNIRFDGTKDVPRNDSIKFVDANFIIPISRFPSEDYIAYSSKNDVQLWLKLLRKDVFERFGQYQLFRYYVISEYGPTTYRSHLHGLLFPKNEEVAEYLLRVSMYKNWQMCDYSKFAEYAHYCDAGCKGYVTQYLTCSSDLPSLLKVKGLKPFRLASKAPAIGFGFFDEAKVSQDVSVGVVEYTKKVERIEDEYVLLYPKAYVCSLFPKCYGFGKLSFTGLLQVYGLLYSLVVFGGLLYEDVSVELRKFLRVADWTATLKCYKFCINYGFHPHTYVYLVDMVYYKYDMFALRSFYEWQEKHCDDPLKIVCSYSNILEYVRSSRTDEPYRLYVLDEFLKGFCLDITDVREAPQSLFQSYDSEMHDYSLEVDDIVSGMRKMSKFYELINSSPTTNF